MASDLKLSGLGSGVDTASIIEALMMGYRVPLNGMEERQEKLNFEKTALRDVNLYLSALRTSLDPLKLESTFLKKSVTSGNEDVVSATASNDAQIGEVVLANISLATATRVSSLTVLNDNADTAAQKQSASVVVSGAGYNNSGVLDTSQTFKDAGFDGVINNGTITINSVEFTIDADVTTVDGFMGEVNNSTAGVTISYSSADDLFTITTKTTGSTASITLSEGNTNFLTEANISTIAAFGDGTINPVQSLAEQTFSPEALTTESFEVKFKINDVPFRFNVFNNSLDDIMEAVNDSDAGVAMSYDTETDKVTLSNNKTGDKTLSLEDVAGNFLNVLNLLDVTRGSMAAAADGGNTSDATISATIKSNTAVNETYTITFNAGGTDYDVVRDSDSATIASSITYYTGVANTLNIDGVDFTITDGTLAPAAGDIFTIAVSNNPNSTPDATAYSAGLDASLDWNGITISNASNSFTRDGVTVSLREDYSAGNILLKVSNDTATAMTAVKSFIEKYNNLMTLIKPTVLTDEQKAYLKPLSEKDQLSMTFAEADEYKSKYEAYNTMEVIRKDSTLNRMRTGFRRGLFSPVDGLDTMYDRLSEIGISTGAVGIAVEQAKDGKLELDEDALIAALESNPDAVKNLFANDASLTSANDDDGIARNLINQINSAISYQGYIERKIVIGGSIDRQLADVQDSMDRMNDRLDMIEERLLIEFTRMETVVSNLNSQGSWLEGQIGQLPKGK